MSVKAEEGGAVSVVSFVKEFIYESSVYAARLFLRLPVCSVLREGKIREGNSSGSVKLGGDW